MADVIVLLSRVRSLLLWWNQQSASLAAIPVGGCIGAVIFAIAVGGIGAVIFGGVGEELHDPGRCISEAARVADGVKFGGEARGDPAPGGEVGGVEAFLRFIVDLVEEDVFVAGEVVEVPEGPKDPRRRSCDGIPVPVELGDDGVLEVHGSIVEPSPSATVEDLLEVGSVLLKRRILGVPALQGGMFPVLGLLNRPEDPVRRLSDRHRAQMIRPDDLTLDVLRYGIQPSLGIRSQFTIQQLTLLWVWKFMRDAPG